MKIFYMSCLILAFALLIWQILSDERRSVTQHIMLFVLVVTNGGYLASILSANMQEAILAQKVIYIGGCFLPMLYFITVCEICRVKIRRSVMGVLFIVQGIVYASVCTIGWNDWYYKNIEFHLENGCAYLTKDYGPLHNLYVYSMSIYLFMAFCVVLVSLHKKTSISIIGVAIMMVSFFLACVAYIGERAVGVTYEIMPMAYIVLFFGSSIQSYRANIFTIEENRKIVDERLSEVGFIAFDRRLRYMGCNTYAGKIFPSLQANTMGRRIRNADPFLEKNILDAVSHFAEHHGGAHSAEKHCHEKIDTFVINDHSYDCRIHTLENYTKKCVGYTVEFYDETEHYKAIELFSNYNKVLEADVKAKTQQIQDIQEKIILGMAQMIESRDLSTGGHIKRTSEVVRIFADALSKSDLGLEPDFLKLVIRSAPMHDLGKIGVDDAILRKQGKFTDEEYEKMKEHSAIGARIVKEVLTGVEDDRFVKVAVNVAHYHHEKVNGTGYPEGLSGDDIPIEARIMALADVFDALVSKRCYKEAFSFDKAFGIIEKDAGSHFDATLAHIFLQCRPQLEALYSRQF